MVFSLSVMGIFLVLSKFRSLYLYRKYVLSIEGDGEKKIFSKKCFSDEFRSKLTDVNLICRSK